MPAKGCVVKSTSDATSDEDKEVTRKSGKKGEGKAPMSEAAREELVVGAHKRKKSASKKGVCGKKHLRCY